jgi:hypothetical protein
MRSAIFTLGLRGAATVLFAAIIAGCAAHEGSGAIPLAGSADVSASGALSLIRSAHRIQQLSKHGIGDTVSRAGGAGYPVTANPPVPHPPEAPCVDKLFNPHTPPLNPSGLPVGDFADYNDHPFDYNPPANCPGPYAKIIFKMHFRVTKGVQYDRTGAVWIGATNVFFGTTSEPGANASPEWNVERDVTEYAPVFTQASVGQASVYNIVNSEYTGIIYGTAELDFYPATKKYPASGVADAIYPLSGSSTGGYVYLDGPSDQLSGTFTFPQNVEAAYLDVFLEPQSNDEFWYTCFPNVLAQKLDNCGGTAFREGEVTVDGQPAGVAPVYPYIFTGGIDPYLWIPIPGVTTLDFQPYRVNLTPFAASLDDGNQHTIAVSVYNDDNYFATNATLLIYEDHGSSQVTGGLISNGTGSSPDEVVVQHVKINASGDAKGTIDTSATHPVSLKGYVMTSKGRITTTVTQSISFSNDQKIAVSSSQFLQKITQLTTLSSNTVTSTHGHATKAQSLWTYPLNVNYNYVASGSTAKQTTNVLQTQNGSGLDQSQQEAGSWSLLDTVQSSDMLNFTASGFTPSNGKSRQQYKSLNLGGKCYLKTITSKDYVVTGIVQGCK